ncbi:hypothetical protein JL49_19505 [Pseudoalteromonas luteoviolacea]|uniref:Uncharacterized protein n=1 Tax=Pseudoalteromonas luteoviolacea NCIMB 1942 TaxID=1365253 RepID=A0A167A9G7_9GAMM|nr:hypothetical protein N482_15215 [Pseudoalteromonas luteoviolacea NCIMB 1942]KZW99053.1 hypothetical protein JL49_19505 [Pseudoalteromonas luteoviolacea]
MRIRYFIYSKGVYKKANSYHQLAANLVTAQELPITYEYVLTTDTLLEKTAVIKEYKYIRIYKHF